MERSPELNQSLQRYYPREFRKQRSGFKYGIELVLFVIVLGIVWLTATVAAVGQVGAPEHVKACENECDEFVRPGDQVWLLSTRHLPHCGKIPQCEFDLKAEKLRGNTWVEENVVDLITNHQNDSTLITMVYVHGNRTDEEWSRGRGVEVYQRLRASQDCPSIRFIIWSWPSERLFGPWKDFQVKADRSIAEGSYLATFLQQMQSTNPVGILGYSLGAQVVLSGLEEYAAFNEDDDGSKDQFNVALVAAATDCNWPTVCNDVNAIYDRIGQLLVVHNDCDRALRAYRLACFGKVNPMGRCGMKGVAALHDNGQKVTQLDVSGKVGGDHSIVEYISPLCVRRSILNTLSRPSTNSIATKVVVDSDPIKKPEGVQSVLFGHIVRAADKLEPLKNHKKTGRPMN